MKRIQGFLIICLLSIYYVGAQDTFLLLSGDTLVLKDYKFDDRRNLLLYEDKKGRPKDVEKEMIYSVTDKDGKEKIYYTPDPDSANERYFSVTEMRDYIQGEIDARANYRAPVATITGFIVGSMSPFVMWYSVGLDPFYSPGLPAAYITLAGLAETSRKRVYRDAAPEYSDNMFYLIGYREVSKGKRIVNIVKGSLVGLAAGITTFIILSLNEDDDDDE